MEQEHAKEIRNLKNKLDQLGERSKTENTSFDKDEKEDRECRFEVILSKTEASDWIFKTRFNRES